MVFNIMNLYIETEDYKKVVTGAFGYGPHYTFTGAKKKVDGVDVYQIVAISEFYSVTPGMIGGWVSSDDILSQEDRCWVDKNVVVIGGSISGNTYLSGKLRATNSKFHNTKINEGTECNDELYVIKESDLTSCVIDNEGHIRNSKLDRVKINEYVSECCDIVINDSVLDRVAIDSEEFAVNKCKLTCLDLSLTGKWDGIGLEGIVSRTIRPEINFGVDEELSAKYMNKKYAGYLQLGSYDSKSLEESLNKMSVANVSSVSHTESYYREDINRLLNSVGY